MAGPEISIREFGKDEYLGNSLTVIQESFLTVAGEFNFTEENCPSNPAFTKPEKLEQMRDSGISMFGLFEGGRQIGFVALERATNQLFYIERLAVLPEFRHKGYGKALLDFAFDYLKAQGAKQASIGIVNENSVLKHWYRCYGFQEIDLKKYEHLPFTVCFMEKAVQEEAGFFQD